MNEMPDFKPISMDGRIKNATDAESPGHHSITDWDFQNVNWELDNSIYHAAPPSLHGSATGIALVKHATTGALSDGRLVAWVRSSHASSLNYFFFRNQVADGSADFQECYLHRILPKTTGIRLTKYVGGVASTIDTKKYTWNWAVNTWYKIRITWWTAAEHLFLRTERWTGTEWVTLGGAADDDIEDPGDAWKDAAVNRCGMFYHTIFWYDDLEVWG